MTLLADYPVQEADIVFIEYTMNDWIRREEDLVSLENDRRRGFETLLRKLLRYERSPAIVIVHAWSPRTLGEGFIEPVVEPEDFFRATPEDHMDTIGK